MLPRQARRPPQGAVRATTRQCAVRYAAYGWPVTTGTTTPTRDPERAQALWSMLPNASVYTVCGEAFDLVEADAPSGRAALVRLERLGVPVGPVLWVPALDRIGFLVRRGTLGPVTSLLEAGYGLRVLDSGDLAELPGPPGGRVRWLREPPPTGTPPLPPAHVVLGGIAGCRVGPPRHV
jgi:hypothetical protein